MSTTTTMSHMHSPVLATFHEAESLGRKIHNRW